jgi:hypothetical protein
MKRRIAIWASVGFLIAYCWILFTFVTPPDQLILIMREPFVEAVAFTSCPIVFAGRNFPLHFWWVPLINAATYAVIGLIAEILRRKSNPSLAI